MNSQGDRRTGGQPDRRKSPYIYVVKPIRAANAKGAEDGTYERQRVQRHTRAWRGKGKDRSLTERRILIPLVIRTATKCL